MTRDEALELLQSEHSERRLDAARELSRIVLPSDEPLLRHAYATETNVWVRRVLEDALSIASRVPPEPPDIELIRSDPVARKLYLEALRETSDRLVHELRSVFGVTEYWARREIANFEESETQKHLARMRATLSAIDELGRASVMARSEEFTVSSVIAEEVEAARHNRDNVGDVRLAGNEELVVRGDPSLVRVIIRNGVANALDVSAANGLSVVLSWGESDRDYWISIIDHARALPRNVKKLFDFGTTTKTGHIGAGLALVQQAAVALGGNADLTTAADGATQLIVQWPRSRSDVG